MEIKVGKNVTTIGIHQFPTRNSLLLLKEYDNRLSWISHVSGNEFSFLPDEDGCSTNGFKAYHQAVRDLDRWGVQGDFMGRLQRKEKGVYVEPGHGVFKVPSKVYLMNRGKKNINLSVFPSTPLAKYFSGPNAKELLTAAKEYYLKHNGDVSFEANESLYKGIVREGRGSRFIDDVRLPTGVVARRLRGYYHVTAQAGRFIRYVGICTQLSALPALVDRAVQVREDIIRELTLRRKVNIELIPMSKYMWGTK